MRRSAGTSHGRASAVLLALLFLRCASQPLDVRSGQADFVRYQIAGGEVGAPWAEITLQGDGWLEYVVHRPDPSGIGGDEERVRRVRLSPGETDTLLQKLVEAGLFRLPDLENTAFGCMSVVAIKASIDQKTVDIAEDAMSVPKDATWRRVVEVLEELRPIQIQRLSATTARGRDGRHAITAALYSRLDLEVEVQLHSLPREIEVEGPTAWKGALKAGERRQVRFPFKASRAGSFPFAVFASSEDLLTWPLMAQEGASLLINSRQKASLDRNRSESPVIRK